MADISNRINDLPLALGNATADFETMDLITPNRLKLGRNNNRCPIGQLKLTNDAEKIIADNQAIFNTWFENWLIAHVPKLMNHPEWYNSDEDLKEGDVVLFLKSDSKLSSTYQYGMVKSIKPSVDGIIRKVVIKYRNVKEMSDRETLRSARELVVIHRLEELDLAKELADINQLASSIMQKKVDKNE